MIDYNLHRKVGAGSLCCPRLISVADASRSGLDSLKLRLTFTAFSWTLGDLSYDRFTEKTPVR